MENKVYGYARVSTREQNEDRQMIALENYPMSRKQIYLDKLSGKDFNRPQYQKLLRKIRAGDTIVIKSIDRLGRDYEEIQNQWRKITKEKNVNIVVLDMPLLDTRKDQDLIGTLISDIVLQLLSYVAQTEREFIHQRQAEGIAAAKARGVHFGPDRIQLSPEFIDYACLWHQGQISSRKAAQKLGISYQTFLRRAKEREYQKII